MNQWLLDECIGLNAPIEPARYSQYMNIYEELAAILRNDMISKGYTVRLGASTDEIVDGYLNLVNRQIQKGPRVFFQSGELIVPADRSQGYHELKRKVESGELLKPHQSTSIAKPDYYDSLFLDWGIQHFHLNIAPHPRAAGFVARSGPLLFARVTATAFYAIQVYEHGAWNKNEIVEILDRNWPSETEPFKLKGLHPITPPHSEQQIKDFRAAGITALAQAGGSLVAPMGGGFRSNGQSSLILGIAPTCRRTAVNSKRHASRYSVTSRIRPVSLWTNKSLGWSVEQTNYLS
jgi:hypothetical protein